MEIFFQICVSVFSVIGICAVIHTVLDTMRINRDGWCADIRLEIRLCEDTPAERLLETADYVRARYFPDMTVNVFTADGIPEDKIMGARLAAKRYNAELME